MPHPIYDTQLLPKDCYSMHGVSTSSTCKQPSLEAVQSVFFFFFESVPPDSQAVKWIPPIQWQWRWQWWWRWWWWWQCAVCMHYGCSWNNGRSKEHHVALASVQILHKSPLLRDHGETTRGCASSIMFINTKLYGLSDLFQILYFDVSGEQWGEILHSFP